MHGDADAALAFVATHTPAPTAPWLTGGETVKSGEHPRPIDSLDGLDFVVPELPGRYRQERSQELGRGGIGRVVTARDEVTGREVAMKQLLPERTADAKSTVQSVTLEARFLREARLAAQLEHPAIVPVYEVGRRADGSLYYTMRRIRGRTLAEAVRAAGTLDGRRRLVSSVLAVAQALAYAHSRSVLHRDVKPQNVMLGAFGETHLLDWGLARVKGRPDSKGEEPSLAPDITGGVQPGAVGTPSYMSPEQALGRLEVMDERTDVWGLGAMLYEVLTGRPPYVGPSAIDVIQQVVADDWTPVKQLVPDAPADLVAVVGKALAKDPARRYASAKDFAEDLEAWLQGRRVSARDYSAVEVAARLVKRNPVASGLLSAALLALLVVGGVSWQRIRAQRNEAQRFASFLLSDLAKDLYNVAGAEDLVETLAREAARFAGRDSVLSLEGVGARPALGRAWLLLGSASLSTGRLDEAERFAADCRRLMWEDEAGLSKNPEDAAVALECLLLGCRSAELAGDAAAQQAREAELARFVEAPRGPWPDSGEWVRARSAAFSRLYRARMWTEPDTARRYLRMALEIDERRLGQLGTAVSADLMASLRDAELAEWTPDAPGPGLAHGERALSLARAAPRRLQNGPVLRAWVGVLTQHLMLLKWSGRAAEAPPLVDEGLRVVEQLLSLQGERTVARGLAADFFIEVGRPQQAQALLATELVKGIGAEYVTSFLLAAFLAGDDAAVLAPPEGSKAVSDPQAQLLRGLALARTGQVADAAALLRASAASIAAGSLQWPRGAFAAAPASASPAVAPHLARFFDAMETALPADDQAGQLRALEALADALAPADAGTP